MFWIYRDGTLFDAKDAHRRNVPRGYAHILDDEPDYGGFLRGRLARSVDGWQLLVVYCREEALAPPGPSLAQLLAGLTQVPVPVDADSLVISDNADVYGTVSDLSNLSNPSDLPDLPNLPDPSNLSNLHALARNAT